MADALIARLQRAGFRGESLRKAWAIVMRESGGNPKAFNGNAKTGDRSYGLAQINMLGSLGPARRRQYGLKSDAELLNPDTNLRVMYQMSKHGTDFGPWAVGPNAYQGAPQAAKTRYRQLYSQFPGAGRPAPADGRSVPPRRTSSVASPAGTDRRGIALSMIQNGRRRRGEGPSRLLSMLSDAPAPQQPVAPTAPSSPAPTPVQAGSSGKGGIRELFYDPLGAYDEGNWIAPIGGHSDHVHTSFGTPQAAMQAIRYAQKLGLRASENPWAEGSPAEKGVHTGTSYHYQSFDGQYSGGKSPVLGKALDVSGDAEKMARYYRWVKSRWGL